MNEKETRILRREGESHELEQRLACFAPEPKERAHLAVQGIATVHYGKYRWGVGNVWRLPMIWMTSFLSQWMKHLGVQIPGYETE